MTTIATKPAVRRIRWARIFSIVLQVYAVVAFVFDFFVLGDVFGAVVDAHYLSGFAFIKLIVFSIISYMLWDAK